MVGEDGISGAALVEFTLFAPLLVAMSIYTMDFGLLLYNKMEVQNAAQAGAHWAIVTGNYSTSNISSAVTNATNFTAITVSSNKFCGCPSSTGVTSATCNSTCSDGSVAGSYVTVSATPTTTYKSFFPYGLISKTYDLSASATVRIK
jgi:Flp pilus assembly protein TadG